LISKSKKTIKWKDFEGQSLIQYCPETVYIRDLSKKEKKKFKKYRKNMWYSN
tara:strand:+ start:4216 stop:4371 length:156 start_codon:yes stop_codon:yes gene_type:complete